MDLMKKLVLILALAILLMGCVEKREVGFGANMRIVNTNGANLDSFGEDEIALYEFTPLSIEISGPDASMLSIRKYMLVYPMDYAVTMNSGLDRLESESYVNDSEKYVGKLYSQCGFNIETCRSPQACKSSCTSLECRESRLNDIGSVLYDFSNLAREKQRLNDAIGRSMGMSSDSKYSGTLAENIIRLMVVDNAIRIHPVVSKLKLCPKEDVALVTSVNGDYEIDTSKYRAMAIYSVGVSSMRYPLLMEIDENIPADLVGKIQIKDVPASATYEAQPNIRLKFNQISLNGTRAEFFVYSFDSEMTNDRISYMALNNGKATLGISTPASEEIQMLIDLANVVFVPVNSLIGMPRLSIMTVFAAALLLVLVAMQALETVAAVAKAASKKAGVKNAALESLGLAMPNWIIMGAAGMVVLFIGIYIESTAKVAHITKIDDNTVYSIIPVTSLVGMFGMVLYLAAIYLIVDVLMDRMKALIGGKYYSRNLLRYSPSEIANGIKELKKRIRESLAELEKYSDKGIDISAEYDGISSLSLDQLNALYEKGEYREANRILVEYFRVVNENMGTAKSKDDAIKANADKWMEILKQELEASKNERINISTLIEIPKQWRPWIVRKFIDERKDEGWVLEENVLKKTEMTEQERIESVIRSYAKEGTIESGAVFSGTTYSGGIFRSGKQSINTALSGRIIKFILAIAPMVKKTRDIVFASYGRNSVIYVVGKGGTNLLLMAKKKISDDKIEQISRKIAKAMGK